MCTSAHLHRSRSTTRRKYANEPYAYDHGQYLATESGMIRFPDWCAANPSQCAFAAGVPAPTTAKLVDKVHAVLDSLDADPVRDETGAVRVNGASMLSELTFRLNGGTRRWVALGDALHAAQTRTGSLMYEIGDSDATFNAVNVSAECADQARHLAVYRTEFYVAFLRKLSGNASLRFLP